MGLLERSIGANVSDTDNYNTASSVAYMDGIEAFLPLIDYNASGYYLEFVLPNGESEFYRVRQFIEGYDFECCVIDHYELELDKTRRPNACV
jgi:hypothetical protein